MPGPGRFRAQALQEAQQLGTHPGSLHTPSAHLPLLSCPLASWSYRAGDTEAVRSAVPQVPPHALLQRVCWAWSMGSKGQALSQP